MDKPSKWFGSNHRVYLHDPLTVAFVGIKGGKKAAQHAILHILTDQIVSKADNLARTGIRLGLKTFLKEIQNFRNQK